jgi:hypothetical protein
VYKPKVNAPRESKHIINQYTSFFSHYFALSLTSYLSS